MSVCCSWATKNFLLFRPLRELIRSHIRSSTRGDSCSMAEGPSRAREFADVSELSDQPSTSRDSSSSSKVSECVRRRGSSRALFPPNHVLRRGGKLPYLLLAATGASPGLGLSSFFVFFLGGIFFFLPVFFKFFFFLLLLGLWFFCVVGMATGFWFLYSFTLWYF